MSCAEFFGTIVSFLRVFQWMVFDILPFQHEIVPSFGSNLPECSNLSTIFTQGKVECNLLVNLTENI